MRFLVHRRAGGLDDEHVLPAHVSVDPDVHLAVGEPRDVGVAEPTPSCWAISSARARLALPLKSFSS
jgi:hypothetical protein